MNTMGNRWIATTLVGCTFLLLGGATFQTIDLNREIDLKSMDTSSRILDEVGNVGVLKSPNSDTNLNSSTRIHTINGILFDIYDNGCVDFVFNDLELLQENPLEKVRINGISLLQTIQDSVRSQVAEQNAQFIQDVQVRLANTLWGKKLVAIGDSLIASPIGNTWPEFIARRNNMVLVNNGRIAEKLCENATNELGEVTNASTISSYTNDIPHDAEIILCQIGANDTDGYWAMDEQLGTPDDDMTTNTFKGCYNNLIIGIRKRYPNAKLGMMLANNWMTNLGEKTENIVPSNRRRRMTQWQKIQCQKLNIPVFDPVEDTRNFPFEYERYTSTNSLTWYDKTRMEIGTGTLRYESNGGTWVMQTQYMRDTQHTSIQGSEYLSFFYEDWIRRAVMTCY